MFVNTWHRKYPFLKLRSLSIDSRSVLLCLPGYTITIWHLHIHRFFGETSNCKNTVQFSPVSDLHTETSNFNWWDYKGNVLYVNLFTDMSFLDYIKSKKPFKCVSGGQPNQTLSILQIHVENCQPFLIVSTKKRVSDAIFFFWNAPQLFLFN